MLAALLHGVRRLGQRLMHSLTRRLLAATTPSAARLVVDTLADLPRGKGALIAENALLRQQRVVLQRSVKRVHCTPADRALLVLLASRVRAWRPALLIGQPETLLRWHRQGFRLVWRRTSRTAAPTATPTVAPETIAVIKEMAAANWLWGGRAHPRRAAQAGHARGQDHHPALHAPGAAAARLGPDVGDLPAHPCCQGHLGV